MFENITPQSPTNKKVEDIFAGVDKTSAAVKSAVAPVQPEPIFTETKSNKKIFFIAGIIIIVVLVAVAAGIFVYKFKTPTREPAVVPVVQPAETLPETVIETPVVEQPAASLDSDSDGLTDEEEATLGTNPNKADTDADSLFDYDEVKVYQTDPLKTDTDGDGYLDGEEVSHGYNPKGPGKLLNVQEELQRIQNR